VNIFYATYSAFLDVYVAFFTKKERGKIFYLLLLRFLSSYFLGSKNVKKGDYSNVNDKKLTSSKYFEKYAAFGLHFSITLKKGTLNSNMLK
jgi:hypothetical protein